MWGLESLWGHAMNDGERAAGVTFIFMALTVLTYFSLAAYYAGAIEDASYWASDNL